MIIVIVAIFGLIIGSFLNAVIYRLHSGQSIVSDRSRCIYCHHELAAKDLIPIFSFIWLRGRCRYCQGSISWQYPIIELTTALSFALLAYNYNLQPINYNLFFALVFICFLIVIGVFDFKHFLILDKVVYPALLLGVVWQVFFGKILDGLLAALIIAGFFAVQYFISKGRWIGFGDVKFGLFLGMVFGVKLGLVMVLLGYFIGALTGLILIFLGKKHLGSKLPFGSFLSISGIIVLIWGERILNWYLGLIGIN
ncbi:MAG: hypothetical protein A3B10_02450 [Candidatus Doudnabacteria bacterium RIFCSPLOWO2_01_FULL_44_21]|uniref:Prepilin peptidase n=1 Tax=Candidatus Doudnabacteria bacterium RIFCSPLOWO2_01_FULL_44_21 TaxID=1817841 RepID=A0A1F5PY19_9BACT|nr:MAG: hypothetical protein A3B95_01000 [Candidatus Doudnabacteria bacterium RIFCSPHIGHO2_02_FULL_43_13b]OGE94490.1 MAG: hypothetical protein A3B10_02450 [Candidatus Doudnabacteria bacterium RIFCSPLOWO2_01_FULL_44_21]